MTVTIGAAIATAAKRLEAISATPRLDAELLMAHALGTTRETMLLGGPGGAPPAAFAALAERREGGEPVAYLLGRRAFWTIELEVTPAVLIPRADSETLIEAAVDHFRGSAGPRTILDLGTGSGALLLAALDEWPGARGIGLDRSAGALAVARANAVRLGFGARAAFVRGDWAAAIDGHVDLLLCNPPYVETGAALAPDVLREPHDALFAGADGLDACRALGAQIARLIAPGGIGCVEIGSGQARAAGDLFRAQGLSVEVRTDLERRDRCLALSRG